LTNQELISKILRRLGKLKLLILLGGILFAALMFFYAKSKPIIYSARSSFFPLTSGADNSGASKLSELIGTSGSSKSLSEEANVNIEEVARSKKTREAVVAERIPTLENKTIAELLIKEYNYRKSFNAPAIEVPKVDTFLYQIGAQLIQAQYTVKLNKNNLLEIVFNSSNQNLLEPITNVLTKKVIEFYKELKIKKATFDFEFLEAKVDSFDRLLDSYDKQRIYLNNTTLFVPPSKLKYTIPREKLESDKILVTAQRNSAVYNREEALLRLKKVTPIIEVLDKPTPPYAFEKPSKVIYTTGGFFLGCLFFAFLFVIGLIFKFSNAKITTTINENLIVEDKNIKK
jgi:uncharacterized protein involved in exopolysaccharide biosynthesis